MSVTHVFILTFPAPRTVMKKAAKQAISRRVPRQARALDKVGLILEAALRILDREGLQALNTNHLAETAGVSVGTVYQYFKDKAAILDALAARELGQMTGDVMKAITGQRPATRGDRVRAVIRAVMRAYGGRTRVHGVLFQHVTLRGGSNPFPALRDAIGALLSGDGVVDSSQRRLRISSAEAFVLTNAISGVIRALMSSSEQKAGLSRAQVEDALVKMVLAFVEPREA